MERIVDKSLLIHRFSRAIETYNREAIAQQQIASQMGKMLDCYLSHPCHRVLEIGSGTGFLTRYLMETLCPDQLILNDICQDMRSCFTNLIETHRVFFQAGDAEQLTFPSGQDLIVSCSVLQWFACPEKFFERCNAILAHRGYMAFSTFGQDNLREIKTVTGVGLDYRSMDEWKQMLMPYYDIVATSEEQICVTFGTPLQVLHHLKNTGVTAINRQAWTKKNLQRFCDEYTRLFAENRHVRLTYHPIYVIARKRT